METLIDMTTLRKLLGLVSEAGPMVDHYSVERLESDLKNHLAKRRAAEKTNPKAVEHHKLMTDRYRRALKHRKAGGDRVGAHQIITFGQVLAK